MHPLLQRLANLRRRLSIVAAGAAVGLGLSVTIAGVIAAALLDRAVHLDPAAARLALTGLAILTGVVVGTIWWRRLRSANTGLTGWALRVEERWPATRGILAAATDLLSTDTHRVASPELGSRVVEQASTRFSDVPQSDLRSLVVQRPLGIGLGLLALTVLIVAGITAGDPRDARIAARRILLPIGAPAWPRANTLRWLDENLEPLADGEIERRVAAGEALPVFVDDAQGKLPESILLHQQLPDGHSLSIPLRQTTLVDSHQRKRRVATTTLLPVSGIHRLTARGGDDNRLPILTLTAESPPAITTFEITIHPPAYTGSEPATTSATVGHVRGVLGSRVAVHVLAAGEIASCVIQFENGTKQPARVGADSHSADYEIAITQKGVTRYTLQVTAANGLSHPHPPQFEITGDEDAPPTIALEKPAEDLRISPAAEIAMAVSASDDFGLGDAFVELKAVSGDEPVHRFDLPRDSNPAAKWEAIWKLEELSLQPGQQLEMRAIVADRRPEEFGGPQVTRSAARRVMILSAEDVRQRLAADERALSDDLQPLQEALERDTNTLKEIRAGWRGGRTLDPASRDAVRRLADSSEALSRRLGPEGLERRLNAIRESYKANQFDDKAADVRLKNAGSLLKSIAETLQPSVARALRSVSREADAQSAPGSNEHNISPESEAAIDESLATAESDQRESSDSMAAAAEQLASQSRRDDSREALEQIAGRQKAVSGDTEAAAQDLLSKSSSEMTPNDRSAVGRLAERQRQLAQSTERLARDVPQREGAADDAVNAAHAAQLMNDAAGALDDFKLGQALDAQKQLAELFKKQQEQLESRQAPEEQLVKTLTEAVRDLKSLTAEQSEWRKDVAGLSAAASNDPAEKAAREELRKTEEQSADVARKLAARLRRTMPEAGRQVADAAEQMQRAAEQLEDENRESAQARSKEAQQKLEDVEQQLARQRQSAAMKDQLSAYEQARTALTALADRQANLRNETARLDDLQTAAGKLTRGQLRALNQLAEDQSLLTDDTSAAAKEAPDDVTRLAISLAEQLMSHTAARLKERALGDNVRKSQRQAEDRLRMISKLLAMEPPESEEQSPESQPNSGEENESGNSESLVLGPQLAILKELQNDLLQRTTELDKTGDETSMAAARSELANEQQRLTDLIAQTLAPLVESASAETKAPAEKESVR
jgi:hypothetical protein